MFAFTLGEQFTERCECLEDSSARSLWGRPLPLPTGPLIMAFGGIYFIPPGCERTHNAGRSAPWDVYHRNVYNRDIFQMAGGGALGGRVKGSSLIEPVIPRHRLFHLEPLLEF